MPYKRLRDVRDKIMFLLWLYIYFHNNSLTDYKKKSTKKFYFYPIQSRISLGCNHFLRYIVFLGLLSKYLIYY